MLHGGCRSWCRFPLPTTARPCSCIPRAAGGRRRPFSGRPVCKLSHVHGGTWSGRRRVSEHARARRSCRHVATPSLDTRQLAAPPPRSRARRGRRPRRPLLIIARTPPRSKKKKKAAGLPHYRNGRNQNCVFIIFIILISRQPPHNTLHTHTAMLLYIQLALHALAASSPESPASSSPFVPLLHARTN
jgi:hypothetical protein